MAGTQSEFQVSYSMPVFHCHACKAPCSRSDVWAVVEEALDNPIKSMEEKDSQKEESREICSQNGVHQADQILRKLIREKIEQSKGNCINVLCIFPEIVPIC